MLRTALQGRNRRSELTDEDEAWKGPATPQKAEGAGEPRSVWLKSSGTTQGQEVFLVFRKGTMAEGTGNERGNSGAAESTRP